MYTHSNCAIPIPMYRYNLMRQQERILPGSSLKSSRTMPLLRQALGFLHAFGQGPAGSSGKRRWWLAAPWCWADLVLQRLQSSDCTCSSSQHCSCFIIIAAWNYHLPHLAARKKAEIIMRGGLRFLPTFPSIESSVSLEREELQYCPSVNSVDTDTIRLQDSWFFQMSGVIILMLFFFLLLLYSLGSKVFPCCRSILYSVRGSSLDCDVQGQQLFCCWHQTTGTNR